MSTTVIIGQAPTNIGPLTTTFTPPPECTVAVGADRGLLGLIGGGRRDVAWLGQSCFGGEPVDATTCWPPASSGTDEKKTPLQGWGFYSPGLHCPAGYATACSATGGSGGGSDWPVQFRLRDGETAVGCCPSGYGCANVNGQTCTMIATSTTTPTVTCDGSKSGDFAFQTVPDEEGSITAFSLFAPMIQMNWQSSDRPEPTSTEASLRPTASETTAEIAETESSPPVSSETQGADTGRGSTTQTLEIDDNPQSTLTGTLEPGGVATPSGSLNQEEATPSGQGFSSGTKVGLAVAGSAIGMLMLVCALFYVWRRRKLKREEAELDRLYGMKHASGSASDLMTSEDIPGWYRGQRLTPLNNPTYAMHRGLREKVVLQTPESPYYRGYSS